MLFVHLVDQTGVRKKFPPERVSVRVMVWGGGHFQAGFFQEAIKHVVLSQLFTTASNSGFNILVALIAVFNGYGNIRFV